MIMLNHQIDAFLRDIILLEGLNSIVPFASCWTTFEVITEVNSTKEVSRHKVTGQMTSKKQLKSFTHSLFFVFYMFNNALNT